jgi:hypothetical protein
MGILTRYYHNRYQPTHGNVGSRVILSRYLCSCLRVRYDFNPI